MKIKWMYALILAFVTMSFVGCSKDDNTTPSENKGVLKVTVTPSSDYVAEDGSTMSVSVNGANTTGVSTLWKVNGADGTTGQNNYSVPKEYFKGGKTAILETQSSYSFASVQIAAHAYSKSFKLNYKIEQGGKVVVEKVVDVNVGATPTVLMFSY